MGLGTRQVRRLAKKYRKHRALALIRKNYYDFDPTFAAEKLLEKHEISISSETLRQWMISDGIWKPKSKKKQRNHPTRERRPRMGELVQIDGTPHDWFERRSAKCSLMVFIDDATRGCLICSFTQQKEPKVIWKD